MSGAQVRRSTALVTHVLNHAHALVVVQLGGVDLAGASLRDMNLRGANLDGECAMCARECDCVRVICLLTR